MQANDPRKSLERILPWALFCVGYVFTNFLTQAVPMRLLWYLPLARQFTFERRPLVLGVDFYGRVLTSLIAGGLCALATVLVLRTRRVAPRPAWLRGVSVWLIGLLLFTSGLYVYILRARQPIPATLPAGYVPR